MLITEQFKRSWIEEFNNVTALYDTFIQQRSTLRGKRAEYNGYEVEALPIDFVADVEIKAKRALPEDLNLMFLRLAEGGNLELLPQAAKLILGKAFKEYGLGVDGSYSRLYYTTKNEQVRNFLKERVYGAGVEHTQFD
jgi:hypothetical protein